MTCTLTHSDIAGFTGTEQYFKHPLFSGPVYTDGVQYIGANGCGWLLDMILANIVHNPKLMGQDFIAITMTLMDDKSAVVSFEDGDYGKLHRENVEYTDCTLNEIKFFFTNGVLMLASEY